MVGQEILLEIDNTLDQLIRNAEAMEAASMRELSEVELAAFEKTQESLIHHLLVMDEKLAKKPIAHIQKHIEKKRATFTALQTRYQKPLFHQLHRKSEMLSKRRSKRFLAIL